MKNRECIQAILHYQPIEKMPVVNFGYWTETLRKWHAEGHIPGECALNRPMADKEYEAVHELLGFDFNWNSMEGINMYLLEPQFEEKIQEELPDGKQKVRTKEGDIVIIRPGVVSIPLHVGHTLADRESWEELYLPKLKYGAEVIDTALFERLKSENETRENPLGLYCGSLFGRLRNWLGLVDFTYLWYDEPELFEEMIDTIGNLLYRQVENHLKLGVQFDYAHFWEDICGNDGPLVNPDSFSQLAGPHYKRITKLLADHGIDIVSVDCDGCIDRMVPIWLENGVNTMFPIEVGNWNASIGPWREQYGKQIRGVGGMNKKIFALDYAAIDKEIERMRPLVEMGGYIPCPDHRIPPDAKWENVQYYCDRFRRVFDK